MCSLPPNALGGRILSLQLCHCFSPLMLCDGSPGFASLSGNFPRDVYYCPFFFVLRAYKPHSQALQSWINWLTSSTKHGPASISSYPEMCDRPSSPAWALVAFEPSHELVQLSTTKENIWGILGRWAVKLIYLFTGLAGWAGSLGCPLSGRKRETTKPHGREQDEQKDWGTRNVSKLLDQLYHQTVPEYPLYKHTPYLLLETVSWVS